MPRTDVSRLDKPARAGELRSSSCTLSVVIVAYECLSLLQDCLATVRDGAGGLDFEVIVVDNASADGTVSHLARHHPAVRCISNSKNLGFAKACNQGLRAARGAFVLALNPDTRVQPRALAVTVDYLRTHAEVAAATCKVVRPNGELDPSCKREFPSIWDAFARFSGLSRLFPQVRLLARYDAAHLPEDRTQEVPLIDGCFMMFRRSALDEVGPFDERFFMYAEEMDWCRRAADSGWRLAYVAGGTTVHIKGAITRRSTFRMLYHFHRSMALYFAKYHRKWNPAGLLVYPGIGLRLGLLIVLNAVRSDRRVSG
jgi:GT2 family glycosyltransferase